MFELSYQTVTILSGQTESNPVQLARSSLVGIRIPGTFTGTTISIMESDSQNGTYQVVNPSGAGSTYPVTASNTLAIPVNNSACCAWVKLKSDSSEGANRNLTIITRTVN